MKNECKGMKEFKDNSKVLNLLDYVNKTIMILADNGETFIGTVEDYFYADENVDGKESLIVKVEDGGMIEFKQEDIDEISLL